MLDDWILIDLFRYSDFVLLFFIIAGSSNGRTTDSESVNHGSNPCPAAA